MKENYHLAVATHLGGVGPHLTIDSRSGEQKTGKNRSGKAQCRFSQALCLTLFPRMKIKGRGGGQASVLNSGAELAWFIIN